MANARSESNDMLNGSCDLIRNESLDQQEMDMETKSVSGWEGDGRRHAKTCDEEIMGTSHKHMENLGGTSFMEETDAKEGMQYSDSNYLQQRIEAIRVGKQREKDKMAFYRAFGEAPERALAKMRETAERAVVEIAATTLRQRVMAEAREKAKLRAERAAVERAVAEAREHFLNAMKHRFSSSVSTNSVVSYCMPEGNIKLVHEVDVKLEFVFLIRILSCLIAGTY